MPEPLTIAGIGGAVWASKDLIYKLLGPSCDYLGESTANLVRRVGDINLTRIFEKTIRRLGEEIDVDGAVAPRVLKKVWDEGRFVDNDLVAEYYAGALESARRDGNDDTLPFLSALEQMSSNEVRFHYEIYLYERLGEAIRRISGHCSYHQDFRFNIGRDVDLLLENLARHGLIAESTLRGAPVIGNDGELMRVYRATKFGKLMFYLANGLKKSEFQGLLKVDLVPLLDDTLLNEAGLDIFLDPSGTLVYTKRGFRPPVHGANWEEEWEMPPTKEEFPIEWLHGTRFFVKKK